MNSTNIHSEKILILDFGSQVTQLIARRVREIGVYCEIMPWDADIKHMQEFAPQGIILSGGPESTTEEGSPRAPAWVFEAGIPVLGICYGLQTMAVQLGGKVEGSNLREFGYAAVEIKGECPLFDGLTDHEGKHELDVWMSHGDKVTAIPEGFEVVGSTDTCPFAAVYDKKRNFFGAQFHPEVTHTKQGGEFLRRFVIEVCKLNALWSPMAIIDDAVARIRREVGDAKVLLGLSGGVDSSVAALLIHKAIGDQLVCVFVNNGMLRKGEAENVLSLFGQHFNIRLQYADAEEAFLAALKGKTDPEDKRKTIGKLFVDTFYNEARKCGDISYLAQGTLYPDIVESRSPFGGPTATIKSHHNVGGLPSDLKWKLLEPLKELFKDEVRELGRELGLPDELVNRHPFPGPGLGVRCIGEVTKERLDALREIDAIFIDEIRKAGLYGEIWQALADLLPVKSVGVQGDERTYREVCTLRAVTSQDAMTADWYRLPYDVMQKCASRICNEVSAVNRVLYDITSKPPATIEWE